MAEREMPDATPFKFVSAAESCDDLPRLYDAKPDTCILHPDHRVMIGTTKDMRVQTCLIPTQPWGMNFAKAWYGMDKKCAGSGVLTQADRDSFPADAGTRTLGRTLANSSAFGRLMPNRPFITITTRQSPGDAKNGTQLHWQEPRPITLMEARRAQGFRDHEVLLGSVSQQYRIVGNSVAREVAVALGLMFREAEYGSLTDGEEDLSRLMEVDTEDLMDTTTDAEEAEDLLSLIETSSRPETVTTNVSMRSTPATTKRPRSTSTLLTVEIPTMKRSRRISAAPSSDGTTTPSARRSRSSSRRTLDTADGGSPC
jgi:DNA (cytosine-5)-methyltransferase 1